MLHCFNVVNTALYCCCTTSDKMHNIGLEIGVSSWQIQKKMKKERESGKNIKSNRFGLLYVRCSVSRYSHSISKLVTNYEWQTN